MMQNLMEQTATSTSEVMETMFFLPVEKNTGISIEESGLCGPDEVRAAGISFSGAVSGRIRIFVPETLLRMMAGNFMGLNTEEVSTDDTAGTLTEALNMIAGNALRKIDDRVSSHLGLPEPIDPHDLRKTAAPVIFETIGGRLAIDAELRQPSGTDQKGEA
ncbi:MAG: chemotaxis protein CheX [Desulfarculaceae bacterium]|nr:chemotaxis protein CheX [Desulfarculaceae bacterium]